MNTTDRPALNGREAVRTAKTCTADRKGRPHGAALYVIAEAERTTERENTPFCHVHGYVEG